MGRYAAANIRIESHRQFPDVGCEPEFSPPVPAEGESVVGSLESEGETSGLSFAKVRNKYDFSLQKNVKFQMLSSKRPCPTAMWPSLKSDRPASGPRMITATGHNTKVDFSRVRTQSDSDVEPDGYVAAPSFNQSFGDAIAIALEKAALCDDAEGDDETRGVAALANG